MIAIEETTEDPLDDRLGSFVLRFRSHKTWTPEKRAALAKLINELRKKRYKAFTSHYTRYKIQRIGESYCYQVPEKKQGHLAPFRGQLVRIICVGQLNFERKYMVGVFHH